MEGAGVDLNRIFGFYEAPLFDPFLMMDHFGSDDPDDYIKGFPWHPHRGIETITYMLEGEVEHRDSLGNTGKLLPGDIQWMTAGSGIIHQEMPGGDEKGRMFGFQLWANLPASQKMMSPRYQDIKSDQVPEIMTDDGVRIRVICGKVNDIQGPVHDIIIDPEYIDVTVPANCKFNHVTRPGHTVFSYVFEGEADFSPDSGGVVIGEKTLVLYEDGDSVLVSTGDKPVRFLLISGKPIGEPIAWHGPIVMNTKDELRVAINELNSNTFIKHKIGQS